METLLNKLKEKISWQEFFQYKKDKDQLSRQELQELERFIAEERYLELTASFEFGLPEKKLIVKRGSGKKRTVYCYSPDETILLKHLAFLLYKYDGKLCRNCYSFRKNRNAKTAFDDIRRIPGLDGKYMLKLDIHDYFNSIDVPRLITILEEIIDDDLPLLDFLRRLLEQDRCVWYGEVIEEKRGAMAGVPLSGFFADIFLIDLDKTFLNAGIPYFRYSDDMILFFDSEQQLEETFCLIRDFLSERDLALNMDKYRRSIPGEPWEFLGFRYCGGVIDLSETAVNKMKGKIRRKARKLYRKRKREGIPYDKAARSIIRSFDNVFYDLTGKNDFTWTRFYFPVITVSDGLSQIDAYMIMYLRYLYSGRHYKGNYAITYDHLKKLGYTPLKAEYYRWKKDNAELVRQQEEHESGPD